MLLTFQPDITGNHTWHVSRIWTVFAFAESTGTQAQEDRKDVRTNEVLCQHLERTLQQEACCKYCSLCHPAVITLAFGRKSDQGVTWCSSIKRFCV